MLVGDRVSALFENRDTVLLQIQEMLRTERITREAGVQHEIATYNQLVPGPRELSATLMIEVPDQAEREAFLDRARGIEKHVALVVDGEHVADCSTPTAAHRLHQMRDCVVRVNDPAGGGVGWGNLQSLVLGAHPALGLSEAASFL